MEKKMAKRKIRSRRPALSCDLLHEMATSRHRLLSSQHFDKAASCSTLLAFLFFFARDDVRSLTFFQRKQAKWLLLLHMQQPSVWE